jgi:hypothetical protein
MRRVLVALAVIVISTLLISTCRTGRPQPGEVKDEALAAGRLAESMPGADEDYYADMDYGVTKNPEAVRTAIDPYLPGVSSAEAVKRVVIGRNNWVAWTAGNDRLWDVLSVSSVGNLDLLKTISDHPSLKNSRSNRWSYLGLVNEPCFRKGTGPRQDRFGLWLDERVTTGGCGEADPFENETKYPGVRTGARGKNIPAGSYYGYATGVVGLRLFPNPKFDEVAQKRWDPARYYTDPSYYNSKDLVKPYRVGMSCGFCHVGPNPTNPPHDPENPSWANLNSNPGAQYFWIDRIFMFDKDTKSFVWQLFHTSRPGALDTSLVSSDQINNPRSMNAIYNLPARLEVARRFGTEQLAGGSSDNKQFNDYVPPGTPLTNFYDPATKVVRTTHVLKDGSDAVGALGALNRVYVNIGLFSEEWLLHFIPLAGGPKITAIEIKNLRKNSTYWNANELQTPNLALFFIAAAKPDYLKKAPEGAARLARDADGIPRGKQVFAERCARCHSSKLPDKAFTTFFQPGCGGTPGAPAVGPGYVKCWNDYWQWTKTAEFKNAMKEIVNTPDFLENNFLSTELRVPQTLLETNVCSSLATNAIRDNIWDNFSSESYKNLPSAGSVTIHDPYDPSKTSSYDLPAGGRGYTRPASLVSVWSTAPYLQNNSVGHFDWTGNVKGRLESFDDSIEQLLWPERRHVCERNNPSENNDKCKAYSQADYYNYNNEERGNRRRSGNVMFRTDSGKMAPGYIDYTTERTYLAVAPGYLPPFLARLSGTLSGLFPNVFHAGEVRIGPIPAGTPVNLLSNIDLQKKDEVLGLLLKIKHDLNALPSNATDEEAERQFSNLKDRLLSVSKCSDFIVNRGHYFGTDYLPAREGESGLSDADKRALIAFLETF